MKPMRLPFLASSALALLPFAVVLAGCGGGGSDSTPVPSSTPTPTPTAGPFIEAPINFGNGQNGTLSLRVQGITATGQLQVFAPVAAVRSAQALGTITPGIYRTAGTVTPPRNFLVTGKFPDPIGAYVIQGSFPTLVGAGAYTLTVGGETIKGVYPIAPTPTPTAIIQAQ